MSSPVDLILSRLDKPRAVGPGRWKCACPAHGGMNRTTLAVSAVDDGRVLVHCFAACRVDDVVAALGLRMEDLFPPKPAAAGGGSKPMRQPFIPAQVFDAASFEATVGFVICSDVVAGRPADLERMALVVQRLGDIGRGAYGRR